MNTNKLARAVLWMVGALLSFSTLAVSIRGLAHVGFSIFEILAVRAAGILTICGILMIVRPALRAHTRPQRMGLNLLRNTIHFVSQYAWATSLTLLPLAMVFALEFTMPIWTAVFAVWFLRERMTASRAGVIVLGLIGVLVILRPGIAGFHPAALLVLGAAVGYALTMITTKELTNTSSTFSIIFWMGVIQFPLALAGSHLAPFTQLTAWDILPMLGVAIAGTSAHYCLSNAFRAGDATLVVPLDFIRIPLIAVVGWALYGERLDVFVLLGAAIIVTGVMWNLRAESRRARQAVGA